MCNINIVNIVSDPIFPRSARYATAFALLILLAVCFDAAASDLYSEINRLRAGEGECAAAENLPPFKPQAVLERVARDLSRGDKLEQSLKAAGYRATRSSAIAIRGNGVGAQAAGLLAKQNYCQQWQDAAMTEIGIYLDARQMWIVMAIPSTPFAPSAPSGGLSGQAGGRRVLDLVNQVRATPRYCGNQSFNSARLLHWSDALAEASRLHSEDMARNNYFSHSGRDGSGLAQRVDRTGYRYRTSGENIAAGAHLSAEDAVAGWIKSPGHCANLMNPAFVDMGAAYAVNPGSEMGVYWTQVFGTSR
jgi:uncharacterized protein YkwD